MPYQTNDQAPLFETQDVFGQHLSSDNFRGRTWLLSFFRFSSCALCNLQIHHLIQKYHEYHEKGLEVVAVFESSEDNVRANVGKQSVPFSLVADPTARLYDLFELESSPTKIEASMQRDLTPQIAAAAAIGYPLAKEEGSNFFRMPADFLIGPDGQFLAAFYSEVIGSHLSFGVIEEFLLAQGRPALH